MMSALCPDVAKWVAPFLASLAMAAAEALAAAAWMPPAAPPLRPSMPARVTLDLAELVADVCVVAEATPVAAASARTPVTPSVAIRPSRRRPDPRSPVLLVIDCLLSQDRPD